MNDNLCFQVANDGYTAFNNAHINMDKIRLETLEIPKSLKKALTILFKVFSQEKIAVLSEIVLKIE